MQTLEALRRQIDTTESLHAVVRTMKVLSMTSIRQCEEAVDALDDYYRTVELGLHVALRHQPPGQSLQDTEPPSRMAVLVFGSVWGMCGRFNEQLAHQVNAHLDELGADPEALVVLGDYVGDALEQVGRAPTSQHAGPESVEGITRRVQEVLVRVESWTRARPANGVLLFYNRLLSGTTYEPRAQQLLPLDRTQLRQIEQQAWPTHILPTFRMDWEPFFTALVRQYLFASLYRAFAQSLASEHSSRLAAMQRAETNVEERLDALNARFRRQRQNALTEEVLDITAGFEALSKGSGT